MRYGKVVVSPKGQLRSIRTKKSRKSHAIWESCCFREGQLPSSRTKSQIKVMRYGKVVVSAKVSCEAAGQKSHEKSCDMGRLLFPRRSAAKQLDKKVTYVTEYQ